MTDKKKVTTMADSDDVFGNFGGKVGQMSILDFRTHLNDNDNQVLNDIAFYIDVNSPSSLGSTSVDTGGNLRIEQCLKPARSMLSWTRTAITANSTLTIADTPRKARLS